MTAWPDTISHSPSSALCSGRKLPPLRSDSITASTDGGNFRPLQSALLGEWEVGADYAVTGSRTLTLPLVD